MKSKPVIAKGTLDFHIEKSHLFRVVHVDGCVGAAAPSGNGLINMGIFSERLPFPKKLTYRIENGHLTQELREEREGRNGVFRELEANLVLSYESAVSIRDWLTKNISRVDELRQNVTSKSASSKKKPQPKRKQK